MTCQALGELVWSEPKMYSQGELKTIYISNGHTNQVK